MWSLNHTGAPRPVVRRAQYVFVAMVAQAAIGYTQYFNGDPVSLVAVHVAGASILVITLLQFYLGLWAYPAVPVDELGQPVGSVSEGVTGSTPPSLAQANS
jgi:cytochrome c oxidase assembly protein subunit 15